MHDSDLPTTTASPTYCTLSDVFDLLQKSDAGASPSGGNLSDSDVEAFIIDVEEQIDQHTGQAWRERQITNERPRMLRRRNIERYTVFGLAHAPIRDLDAGQGDKVEVWNGSSFDDFISTQTEGRGNDFYVNQQQGRLFVRPLGGTGHFYRGLRGRDALVRITYRYGESSVPRDIKRAAMHLAAASLVEGEIISPQGRGGELDRVSLSEKSQKWVRKAGRLLQPHVAAGWV